MTLVKIDKWFLPCTKTLANYDNPKKVTILWGTVPKWDEVPMEYVITRSFADNYGNLILLLDSSTICWS